MENVRRIHAHGTHAWSPTVSTPTEPSRIIVTNGEAGVAPDGTLPDDPAEQARLAFSSLRRSLEAAGAGVEDIMKLTINVTEYDREEPFFVPSFHKFLSGQTLMHQVKIVSSFHDQASKIEVEAIAAVPLDPPTYADVVIVGAGLSGLTAARDLQKQSLIVKVLEARDRVGGKTWSRPVTDRVTADVGAAWINSSNQERVAALAKEYNLTLHVQNTVGDIAFEDFDGQVQRFPYGANPNPGSEEGGMEGMIKFRQMFHDLCLKVDLQDPLSTAGDPDTMTLEEYVIQAGYGETTMGTVKVWTRAMLGLEPSDVSALYFLDYCKSGGGLMQMRSDQEHGGQYLRIQEGTQCFSFGLTDRLAPETVLLKSPVFSITQDANGSIEVKSGRGKFRCKRVIVSIPTPLYKTITFSPPLPAEKLELSQSTKLGCYGKFIAVYKSPWWREAGFCGLTQSPIGPFTVTRDTSIDAENHYSLTCFMTGEPARQWGSLSSNDRKIAVVQQISRIYGQYCEVPLPESFVEQEWSKEQWSQGCPCPAMGPGLMTKLWPALRAPFGNVHFIGTETAFEWKGYMDGAIRSGERGASEVAAAFAKEEEARMNAMKKS